MFIRMVSPSPPYLPLQYAADLHRLDYSRTTDCTCTKYRNRQVGWFCELSEHALLHALFTEGAPSNIDT